MLVLSRKRDESIIINKDVTIVVVEIRGDKVRLGVDAPRHVTVHRKEVYDAIEREGGSTSVEMDKNRYVLSEQHLRTLIMGKAIMAGSMEINLADIGFRQLFELIRDCSQESRR